MRSYRIGSAFGIPIEIDLTFLLVLPLFAYLIGAVVRPVHPQTGNDRGSVDYTGRPRVIHV